MKICPSCDFTHHIQSARFCCMCGSELEDRADDSAQVYSKDDSLSVSDLRKLLEPFEFEELPGGGINLISLKNKKSTVAIIPHGVVSVGKGAFADCKNLTTVSIPDSVVSIGDSAFSYCHDLAEISFGKGITKIGHSAFLECYQLKTAILPETLTELGERVFENCLNMTEVSMTSVTKIPDNAFHKCKNLTKVTLSDKTEAIGSQAFSLCESLSDINLPKTVKSIGMRAFPGCSALTKIDIPKGVTIIRNEVFLDCKSLTSVTIPSTVKEIGNASFANTAITAVELPDGLTKIDKDGFAGCAKLTRVTLPESLVTLGEGAFMNCSSLRRINIPRSVTVIPNSCFKSSGLTSIEFHEGVTKISYCAFYECKMAVVVIPDTVKVVENSSFYNTPIKKLTLPLEAIKTIGAMPSIEELTLTTGESIFSHTFTGFANIIKLTLPKTVTNIGYDTFRYFLRLKTICYQGTKKEWKKIKIADSSFPLKNADKVFLEEN